MPFVLYHHTNTVSNNRSVGSTICYTLSTIHRSTFVVVKISNFSYSLQAAIPHTAHSKAPLLILILVAAERPKKKHMPAEQGEHYTKRKIGGCLWLATTLLEVHLKVAVVRGVKRERRRRKRGYKRRQKSERAMLRTPPPALSPLLHQSEQLILTKNTPGLAARRGKKRLAVPRSVERTREGIGVPKEPETVTVRDRLQSPLLAK